MSSAPLRHEVVMPRLSDSMAEGVVGKWLRGLNDAVSAGDELLEIETDKVTMTLQVDVRGFVVEVLAEEGAVVPVGAVVAVIGSVPAAPSTAPLTAPAAPARAEAPAAPTEASTNRSAKTAAHEPGEREPGTRILATPLARALVRQAGLELAALGSGSGPNGRVLRQDVERLLGAAGMPPAAGSAAASVDAQEPTRIHRLIAERMTRSKQQVPHFYLSAEVDMGAATRLLRDLNESGGQGAASLNGMLVRACGLALRALPNVNRSWIDGRLVRHADVSVGIAVALDQEELIVPVIRHADQKTLSDLSAESRELAERARNGALRPGELEAATFTVTNLGMFGIDEFHAIINPPESGILAAGAVTDRPAVVDGEVVATKAIRLSLSADHRVYSGATGATFIKTIAGYLEKPLSLCL